jgi:hypothetical protein
LYGALSAYYTSKQVSKWVAPDRYYAAFPYGAYCPEFLREHRKKISSDRPFFLSYAGKTVRDNEYLGFTFDSDEFIRIRREFRRKATGTRQKGGQFPNKVLPLEERWSARFFSLDKIFGSVNINSVEVVEVPWYWNIDNWEGLKEFLSSGDELKRPNKEMLFYREFNKIGE